MDDAAVLRILGDDEVGVAEADELERDDAGGIAVVGAGGGVIAGSELLADGGEGGGEAIANGRLGANPAGEAPLVEEVRGGSGDGTAGGVGSVDGRGRDERPGEVEAGVVVGEVLAEGLRIAEFAADEAAGGVDDDGHAERVADEGLIEPAVDVLVLTAGVTLRIVPDGEGDGLAALVFDGVAGGGVDGEEGLGGEPSAGAGLALGEGDGDGVVGGGGLVNEEEGDDEVVLVGEGLVAVGAVLIELAVEGDDAGGVAVGVALDGGAAVEGEPVAGGDGGGVIGRIAGLDILVVRLQDGVFGEDASGRADEHDVANELGREGDGVEAVAGARLEGEDVAVVELAIDPITAGSGLGGGLGAAGGILDEVALVPGAAEAGAVGDVAEGDGEGDLVPFRFGVGRDGVAVLIEVVLAEGSGAEGPLVALGGEGGDAAIGFIVAAADEPADELDGAGRAGGVGDAVEDVAAAAGGEPGVHRQGSRAVDGGATGRVGREPNTTLSRTARTMKDVGAEVVGSREGGSVVGVGGGTGLGCVCGIVSWRESGRGGGLCAGRIISEDLPAVGGGLGDAGGGDAVAQDGEDDLGGDGGVAGGIGDVHLVEPGRLGRGGVEIEVGHGRAGAGDVEVLDGGVPGGIDEGRDGGGRGLAG